MLALLALAPVVGLALNETPELPFAKVWAETKAIGIRRTSLSLDWSGLEPRPGEYDLTWPKTAASFYPGEGVAVGLVLRDLNTTGDERPADLKGLPWDSPELAAGWRKMADAVLKAAEGLKITSVAIGNESDVYLSIHPQGTDAYLRHLKGAAAYVRKRRPGVPVGTCVTFEGLRKRPGLAKRLAATGSHVFLNYYYDPASGLAPKVGVPLDLARMRAFAGRRPWLLTEAGCQSGAPSSEGAQAEFVATLLREAKVPVTLVWSTDVSPATLDVYAKYYGSTAPAFLEFLGTLGLRRRDGTPKPAWNALADAIKP